MFPVETLLRKDAIEQPVAIVAAHPDDETLALGGHLAGFRDLRIVHLTDGAPRDLADARRVGCADAPAYASLRREELHAALAASGVRSPDLRPYDYPDQEAICHATGIVARLVEDLADRTAVFTHPYEGGHPDHDTAALAVALACARISAGGGPAPARHEFPSYHERDGAAVYGAFWPAAPETVLPVTEARRARKSAALACFRSQAAVIAPFPIDPERIRPAPPYDFAAPPPPGVALYDRWGLAITGEAWQQLARAVLADAGLSENHYPSVC